MSEFTTHEFPSTIDAYDACQTDESIANGDILIIEKEGVIGLAWTWPIAVTEAAGDLHTIHNEDGALDRIIADARFTKEQIQGAVERADYHRFPVREMFRRIK